MKRFFGQLIIITILSSSAFLGCKKEEDSNLLVNRELMNAMNAYYLWYDKLPAVNYADFPGPIELLDALMYKELDRWSYITTKQQLEAYYSAGEFVGYGVGLAFDSSEQLWITFVFNDSPLKSFGADRGWRISAIDGTTPTPSNTNSLLGPSTAGVTRTFTLLSPELEVVSATVTKRALTMNSILLDTTYTINSSKIGYFVLQSFIGPTIDELNSTFSKFIDYGVTKLIIDLRYNGGGSIATASHLANLIAGNVANQQVLGTYVHNNKQSHRNNSIIIKPESKTITPINVVFITTRNSASASELVINGLLPHLPVTLVGDRTYGKPVGMYALESRVSDFAYVPICFKILNSNGEGDYYDGIPVDITASDGVNFAFGNINEPSLSAAISYITGDIKKTDFDTYKSLTYPELKGLRQEIGAW